MTFGGPCVGRAASSIVVSGASNPIGAVTIASLADGHAAQSEWRAARLLDSLFPTYERRGVDADRLALTKPAVLKQ
jgi:hypothetical protein